MISLNFTSEELKKVNAPTMITAFTKYVKLVAKNKTQFILKGKKNGDSYVCQAFECAVPASSFNTFNVPTDANSTEDTFTVVLSTKSLGLLMDSKVVIKDNKISIVRDRAKATEAYEITSAEADARLSSFATILGTNGITAVKTLKVTKESDLAGLLKSLSSNPEASIQVNKDTTTYWNDTVFCRSKNTGLELTLPEGDFISLNCFLATKILYLLESADYVNLTITETNQILQAYLADSPDEVSKIVTPLYDATFENPSEDDLASIKPNGGVEVTLKKEILEKAFSDQKELIHAFVETKELETSFLKNGEGITFMLGSASDNVAKIYINAGEVEKADASDETFSSFASVMPLGIIENSSAENVTICYDDSEDTSVLFKLDDSTVLLSGKI